MAAYGNMEQGFPGLTQGQDKEVKSRLAYAAIDFGNPVFLQEGQDDYCYPFVADQALVTYSADFVTSNSIAFTVNGESITPVVFDTDHATTFAALVVAVEALTGVTVVESDATARTILVETTGVTCTATSAVTLGASQADVTVGFDTSRPLYGIAMHTQKTPAEYEANDAVNIQTSGEILVAAAVAVNSQEQAYLTSAGAWTNVATGNFATNYKFVETISAAGNVKLEMIKKGAI